MNKLGKISKTGMLLMVAVTFMVLATISVQAAPQTLQLINVGAGGFVDSGIGINTGDLASEFAPTLNTDGVKVSASWPISTNIADSAVIPSAPNVLGAQGLNHFDTRTADNGNQFSVEPPDQGLAVGNGFVIEAVNDVFGLRDAATNKRIGGVTSLNKFLGLPSAIDRSKLPGNPRFGPFVSDPKALYDFDTKRFFVTALALETNAVTRGFTGPTAVYIGVSKTSDPRDGFQIFKFDTTNDGSDSITHPGCPCLGDQPLIGMDKNGIYISTNEFPIFQPGFNGAQIYGISKQKLAAFASAGSGTLPPVAYINAGAIPAPDSGIWYTIQPSATPPNDPGNDGNSNKLQGIEYFLSALEFLGVPDNRVALWALTNTNSLQDAVPDVKLSVKVITTNTAYISPPNSVQKIGDTNHPHRDIDSGDDRMQQVVKVDNTIYGALGTAISGQRAGIAYWGIKPSWPKGSLDGTVRVEGYVSVSGNNLQRPSVAMNHQGKGLIAFSLIGPDYFPSAAYISFDKQQGAQGPVYIAGAGVWQDTGFSGASGRQRWGDYSAAVDEAGNIWVGAEYIPIDAFPTPAQLANWGTFIFRVT